MTPPLKPESSALVVVDMQNAYLHPDGSLSQLLAQRDGSTDLDTNLMREAIPGCRKIIDAARAAGVPVIYLKYVYRPDYKDGGVLIRSINPGLMDVGYVAAGSWDAEIVDELKPEPGDFIVEKARYSGFYSTRLDSILRSLNASTLVICGVGTHFCVECTARDAHMRDYEVFIVSDATAEAKASWKQTALESFAFGFGWVITSDDVVSAWSNVAPGRRSSSDQMITAGS